MEFAHIKPRSGAAGENITSPNSLHLKTSGKLIDKNLKPGIFRFHLFAVHQISESSVNYFSASVAGAPFAIIQNYPTRARIWRFTSVCFHQLSGDFAVADERGQVSFLPSYVFLTHFIHISSEHLSKVICNKSSIRYRSNK
jgi:hypothetical protein